MSVQIAYVSLSRNRKSCASSVGSKSAASGTRRCERSSSSSAMIHPRIVGEDGRLGSLVGVCSEMARIGNGKRSST